jgi:integrase
LPSIGLHGLRHSHVSALARAGVPVHIISSRVGHSNPALTLSIYTHLVPGDDRTAAEVTGRLLAGSQ